MATPANTVAVSGPPIPNEKTLTHAARIALEQDKPILLDYYLATHNGTAFLGEDVVTKEKSLVKSSEEYTSPIQKVFGTKTEYIIVTENSIYIVAGTIKKKNISMGSGAPAVSS
jgi:hypothetical protein